MASMESRHVAPERVVHWVNCSIMVWIPIQRRSYQFTCLAYLARMPSHRFGCISSRGMYYIFEFLFNAFWEIQHRRNVPAMGLRFYNVGTNCFAFIQLLLWLIHNHSLAPVRFEWNQRTYERVFFIFLCSLQGVTITLMLTGLFGIDMWKISWPFGISTATLFEIILYASGLLTSHPYIVYRIVMSYKKRTGKMRPFIEAIRPLIPFVSMFVITSVWVIFSHNNTIENEPRILFLLFGTVFSNISVSLYSLFIQCVRFGLLELNILYNSVSFW